jgi:elongator complex protein 1
VKDVNKLYEAALGTYDFDLVVMVAQVAQKDPREYLPFLERLSALPEPLRCHQVDMHLKRYVKALGHLSTAGDAHFDACLALTEAHGLHAAALALYELVGGRQFAEVQALAGRQLVAKGQLKEAGLLLHSAGKLDEAVAALAAGLEWGWCLVVAAELHPPAAPGSAVAVHQLVEAMLGRLESSGRYADAAELVERHVTAPPDPERAVELRLQAEQWMLAVSVASRHGRTDLIATHVRPAAVAKADVFCEGFGDDGAGGGYLAKLLRHAARLVLVREERAANAELYDTEGGVVGDGGDLYSDTTSVTGSTRSRTGSSRSGGSRSSRSSHSTGSKKSKMTHRSKRREKRKMLSLREGGAFEEAALMSALHEIAEAAELATSSLPPLCEALLFLGHRGHAARCERVLQALLDAVNRVYDQVWTAAIWPLPAAGASGSGGGGGGRDQMTANARAELYRAAAATDSGGGAATADSAAAMGGGYVGVPPGMLVRSMTVDDVVVQVPQRPGAAEAAAMAARGGGAVQPNSWRAKYTDYAL